MQLVFLQLARETCLAKLEKEIHCKLQQICYTLQSQAATCNGVKKSLSCLFHGSSFKGFSIVFLLPDWLKLNHLKSRMECGFSDIFSRHICSTLAETMGATN